MVTEATNRNTQIVDRWYNSLTNTRTKSLAALSSQTSRNNYLERKYKLGADPLTIYEVNPRS